MPRTRQRPLDPGDGGSFAIRNRPPVDELPPGFADLLAEYDRINIELGEARRNVSSWRMTLESDTAAAVRADTVEAGQAARAGKSSKPATSRVDEVRTRLENATNSIPALETALSLVCLDLQAARDEAKAADPGRGTERVDTARQELDAAAAAFVAAVTNHANAMARREWLHEHLPWDASVMFTLAELPGVNGLVDVRRVSIGAQSLIKTITEM